MNLKMVLKFTGFLLLTLQCQGRGRLQRDNNIFIALGGPAGHYSLNYGNNIYFDKHYGLGGSIGISPSLIPISKGEKFQFSPRFTVQVQGLYRVHAHELELGGATSTYTYYYPHNTEHKFDKMQTAIFFDAGYSYKFNNGLYTGIYFTPMLFDAGKASFKLWGCVRLGYRF